MRHVPALLTASGIILVLAGCPSATDVASSLVPMGAEPASSTSDSTDLLAPDGTETLSELPSSPASALGACCLGDSCVQLTLDACLALGGGFVGAGWPCAGETCAGAALIGVDNDGDGCSDLDELLAGTDPSRPGDCRDIDNDGSPNEEDADVDGDNIPNEVDDDIDGDGLLDDDDPDPDGDGKIGAADPDEDGDFISDRWDLDDDGDGAPDDEDADEADDEDDDGEGSADRQLDLFERLRTGEISEQDRNAIAGEIVKRLESPQDKARVQATLVDIVEQALKPDRQVPPTTAPVGVNAIDAVYKQLTEAIELARSTQSKPRGPLEPGLMPEVLRDFMARATAVVNMAKTFPSLSIDELGVTVSSLRNTLAPKKLEDVSELVGAFVPDRAIGKPDDERKELRLLSHGTSSLGASFADAEGLDLLSTAARLRDRANRRGGTEAEKEARYTSLLDRMSAVSKDKPDITDALEQVEQEDDAVP